MNKTSYYLVLAQHFKITKRKVIVPNDPKLVNSPYSNIRVKPTEEYYEEDKEYITNLSDRNSEDEISKELPLWNKISTLRHLMFDIEDAISNYKRLLKTSPSTKFFDWKKPLIFKIVHESTTTIILECKYPFKDDERRTFEAKLNSIFFEKTILPDTTQVPEGIIEVKWDDIDFGNNRIYIKYRKELRAIVCENSTKDLQELKQLLFKKSKLGLQIDISEIPYKVVNSSLLDNVVKYLSIQYRLTNSILDIPEMEFRQYLKELQTIQHHLINHFPKDEYINSLMEYHCMDFPVLPVLELNNKQKEPSFIFTILKREKLFLVWENKSDGRATYIFRTTRENYVGTCQNLSDFIRAELQRRRVGLIDYEKQLSEKGIYLNFEAKIIHSRFETWCSSFWEQLE